MDYQDYYQLLGVSKTADEKEIKKAYRKAAREYHPDLHPDDKEAEEMFKKINEAHEVLSDPEKRAQYDQFGSQYQQYQRGGGNPNDFWGQYGGRRGGQQVNYEDFGNMFGGEGHSSFFDMLFGQMAGAQGGAQRPPRKQEHKVQITLEEAFSGTSRSLQWNDGNTLNIKIPRGADTGSKIRFKGKAGNGGDLYILVDVLPHPRYERDGDDLYADVRIDLYTAVLGGKIEVPTIGKTVKLTIPAGTDSGKVIRLRGLGMPSIKKGHKQGSMYAKIRVITPKELSDEETALFEQLRDLNE